MAKGKTEIERFAVLKEGKSKREVKAWQYYSIYDFCRSLGEDRSMSDKIARWCQREAVGGEYYEGKGYKISIVEREVSAC